MRNRLKRYPLLLFFLLTFALSWAIKIPVALSGTSNILLRLLPSLFPAIAALLVAALLARQRGVSALWRSLNPVGARLWLYIVVLFGPAALDVLTLGIILLLGQPMPQWYNPGLRLLELGVALFFACGEELGWRGFLLPRLQVRYTALTSSLIIGVVWTLWHLPEALEAFSSHLPWTTTLSWQAITLLQFLALSILMTWTVNSSKGCIAPACLLHVSVAILPRFMPDAYTQNGTLFWLLANLVLAAAAIVIVCVTGATNLAHRPRAIDAPEQAWPPAG